jgi:hypothetical protein
MDKLCNVTEWASIYVHAGPLVNQVFIYAPCQDISQAFAHNTGRETPEVAYDAVVFVYLQDGLPQTLIVLSLIFIIVLEEDTRSYDI